MLVLGEIREQIDHPANRNPCFKTDSFLAVGREADSSYATGKRDNPEVDTMLAVAREADSSYATEKTSYLQAFSH